MRRRFGIMLATVTVTCLGILLPSTAHAVDGGVEYEMLRSWKTGQCLDTNGVDVYTHTCVFNENQRWRSVVVGSVIFTDNPTYYEEYPKVLLMNFRGHCLTRMGSLLGLTDCRNDDEQVWVKTGYDRVAQYQNMNGYCLDANLPSEAPYGNRQPIFSCRSDYQDWRRGF